MPPSTDGSSGGKSECTTGAMSPTTVMKRASKNNLRRSAIRLSALEVWGLQPKSKAAKARSISAVANARVALSALCSKVSQVECLLVLLVQSLDA